MKILIADDERIITDLLTDSLKSFGYNVFATNSTIEASELIESNEYDLILLDIFFPNQEGITLLKKIMKIKPNSRVIFISSNFNPILIKQAFDYGALGYISKKAEKIELQTAIEKVMQNKKFICKATKEIIEKDYTNEKSEGIDIKSKLTNRELEVLNLIADGMTTNEIANQLFISPKTVESHKSNLMEKFETNKTAKLIRIAVENNII